MAEPTTIIPKWPEPSTDAEPMVSGGDQELIFELKKAQDAAGSVPPGFDSFLLFSVLFRTKTYKHIQKRHHFVHLFVWILRVDLRLGLPVDL